MSRDHVFSAAVPGEGNINNAPVLPGNPEPTGPAPIEVPKSELVPMTVHTPEARAETVGIEQVYESLVLSLTSHFEKIKKIKTSSPTATITSMHQAFYEVLLKEFAGKDISDPKTLEKCAIDFLEERKGEAVRLAMKLGEWEAATLQVASGRRFHIGKKGEIIEVSSEEETGKATYRFGPGGAQKIEPGKKEPRKIWKWTIGKQPKKTEIIHEFELVGGERMEMDASNTLLNDAQRAFLQESGWTTKDLSSGEIAEIDARLVNISGLRAEIYRKTGVPQAEIEKELNFIKKSSSGPIGREYINTKTARLLGEGLTGANVREILEAEGQAVVAEVKGKVEDDLRKAMEDAKQGRADKTATEQLDGQIRKLQGKIMSEDMQGVKQAEIELEISRLQKELELFKRRSALTRELPESEAARDAARKKIEDLQGTLHVENETSVDLLSWSDPSNPESWNRIKEEYDRLVDEKQQIKEKITENNSEIASFKDIYQVFSIVELDSGGKPTRIVPNPTIQARYERLIRENDQLKDKIAKDDWEDKGSSLEVQIKELKAIFTRRKKAVEEHVEILNPYREAEKTLRAIQEESQSVTEKISHLSADEDSIDKIDEKIQVERKKLEDVAKPESEDLLEIQSLEALKVVLPSTGREARRQRLIEAKRGLLPLEIVSGSVWDKYPPAILRSMQIIFGDEIFLPHPPNQALAEQVQVLLGSKKYLDIFVENINPEGANLSGLIVGAYDNIDDVLPAGAEIRNVPAEAIDEEIIDNIAETMRIKAFSLKSV